MKSPMYGRFAKEYDRAVQDNIYNAMLERPSLQAMLPDLKGKKVLDLACGSGVYAEYLLAQGAEVTAVDVSPQMVEMVNDKLSGKLQCYVQDLNMGLPHEPDSAYDVVICPLAVHYLPDLQLLFKDIQRCLIKGGVFVFSTHHPLIDFEVSPSGDYFQKELITEEWDTIGQPVEVSFYRRSLTDLFEAVFTSGMTVAGLSEGSPSPEMVDIDPQRFEQLSMKPNFIFIACQN
ncbi:class I SAM-dependent methyltransferase [Photobacterium lutimaris]|uniref:SAM-dependent methyltransferase n=1 Tax=Photobacterium lutimaris TaxID=388278 RepID=A0A2T3IVV0_9GAMM|nr:class I SAM-dependent methyltransferase [Photobacterium lutimaris]PSU32549.1 SAM-dependent methyltransferase [Photobacterium lutimaris]TDR77759.1 methyltransferase family protein [Photobacterium lutimaris]